MWHRGTDGETARRPSHLSMAGWGRGSWRTRLARKCFPLKLTETLLLTEHCHDRSHDPTNREALEVSAPRAGREGEQTSPAAPRAGVPTSLGGRLACWPRPRPSHLSTTQVPRLTGSLEITLRRRLRLGHTAPPPDGPLRNTCAQQASRAISLGGSCRFAAVCPTSPPRPPQGTARDPGLAGAVPPSGWHNPRGRGRSEWPQGLCLGLSAPEIQLSSSKLGPTAGQLATTWGSWGRGDVTE